MISVQLDFQLAKAKHLLFKSKLRSIIYGSSPDEFELTSIINSPFDKWLYSSAPDRYNHFPGVIELEKLYVEVHTVARSLVAMHKNGEIDKARNGLASLEKISDSLLLILQSSCAHYCHTLFQKFLRSCL